jgi:hypothetical protein
VAQGEPRDRLTEHGEERLRALEVAGEAARAIAEPKRMGGADAEAREPVKLGAVGHRRGRIPQLEQREERAAERDRRERPVDGNGVSIGRSRARGLAFGLSRREAVTTERLAQVGVPDRRADRAGGVRRKPGDVVGRARVPRGEGVADEVERCRPRGS